ncbi:MAG: epoxyqueuosine reductase [Clostridiales bacterium]|nr:epoxyqueuosine reductase [Clostridiales bacterium]
MRQLSADALSRAGLPACGILSAQSAAPHLRGETPPFESVLVALFPYYAGQAPGNLSLYARGADYHGVVRALLEQAAERLALRGRAYTDVSPFHETALAQAAGLGGIGQNGLLISRAFGSYAFIGELVVEEPLLPLQAGLAPGCTQCGACLRACPTGALGESVDPARCLSGLTQRRQVDAQQLALIAAAPLIWGCDACQLCCPANRALPQTALPPFAQELICRLDRSDLEGLSERAFRRRYAGRAFSWRGAWPLHRNLEAQAGRLDADPPQTR